MGLLILNIRNITMYDYWYDYAKPKNRDEAKFFSTDTDYFIVNAKSEDVCVNLAKHFKEKFDRSNNEVEKVFLIERKH